MEHPRARRQTQHSCTRRAVHSRARQRRFVTAMRRRPFGSAQTAKKKCAPRTGRTTWNSGSDSPTAATRSAELSRSTKALSTSSRTGQGSATDRRLKEREDSQVK
jgi:hypothetical protein